MIYADSCVVIYAVESHPRWGGRSRAALEGRLGATATISSLVKLECLVGPLKHRDLALEVRFQDFFGSIGLLDMPEEVYLRGAELRARFGLNTPDALHLACAQHHRCDALWTNDSRLDKASGGMARNIFV